MISYYESYDYIWRKCIQFQSQFLLLYCWIGQWEYTCNRFSQKERTRGHSYNCERRVWLHWQYGPVIHWKKVYNAVFNIFWLCWAGFERYELPKKLFFEFVDNNSQTMRETKSHNKSLASGQLRSSLRFTIYTISCHTFPPSILPLNDPIFGPLLYYTFTFHSFIFLFFHFKDA